MAAQHKHFRLLDLPPELRVRIYECFFEPSLRSSTRIDILDVETIKRHAPGLAILATNHLVRREAYDTGKEAERQYFHDHSFFLEIKTPAIGHYSDLELFTSEMVEFMATVTSLPRYPVSTVETRLSQDLIGKRLVYACQVINAASDGKIGTTARQKYDFGHGPMHDYSLLDMVTKSLGVELTRSTKPITLDIRSLVEVVLCAAGWVEDDSVVLLR
ncbi:hypothetical protein LTS10_010697 [Elasticomyces elasticus]|nr:hypothetical protein LTS10_010697 [Elasticomyces elasticus]